MPGSLFGGDGVVGKIFAEALDDEAFGALVRLRDEIHFVAFVSDVQRARQFFDEDFAGLLGDFDGSFEIVLRHRQVLGSLASRQAGAQPAAAGAPTRIASPSGVFHFTTSGSSRGGLRSVANTGVRKVRFRICSNDWIYGRIFGSVANKEVRGLEVRSWSGEAAPPPPYVFAKN